MIVINQFKFYERLEWEKLAEGIERAVTKKYTFILCKGQLKIEVKSGSNIQYENVIKSQYTFILKSIAELMNV